MKSTYLMAGVKAIQMQARNCEDPYYDLLCEHGLEPNSGGYGEFATEEVCLEAGQCYTLEVTEGGYPEEIFFDFLGIVEGAPYIGEFCVPDNEPCLTMYMYDTYGDGWNGAEYKIYTGELAATGGMDFDWDYYDWYSYDYWYSYDDYWYDSYYYDYSYYSYDNWDEECEVSNATMMGFFYGADVDGDEEVTAGELSDMVDSLTNGEALGFMMMLLEMADVNEDGSADFDELYALGEAALESGEISETDVMAIGAALMFADVIVGNNDDAVEPWEMEMAIEELAWGIEDMGGAEGIIDFLDTDGSGTITPDEVEAVMMECGDSYGYDYYGYDYYGEEEEEWTLEDCYAEYGTEVCDYYYGEEEEEGY